MKTAAIFAIVLGAFSSAWGAAVLTAAGHPPEWASWHWSAFGFDVTMNHYGSRFYAPVRGGTATTALIFWPPYLHHDFTSAERSALLGRGDWTLEEAAEYTRLKEHDDSFKWMWPRWWPYE